MAEGIPPLSTTPVGMSPDRQPRRGQREQAGLDETRAVAAQAEDNRAEAAAAAVVNEQPVMPETLFSASVLGQRVRTLAADLQALKLQREHEWSPPESALRLKDKSI